MSEKDGRAPRVFFSEADVRAIQESLADFDPVLDAAEYRDHRDAITSSNTPRISTLMRQTKSAGQAARHPASRYERGMTPNQAGPELGDSTLGLALGDHRDSAKATL